MDNKTILKQKPREEMLFWRLTGSQNVVITEGDVWREQVPAVRRILQTNVPMHTFVSLGHKLMSLMGDGGRITWNHLAHRFALDVVGFAVMGHDFEALEKPDNSLVKHYREVMSEITHPLYIAFPILERLLPRRRLTRRVDELRSEFLRLLELKRENPGLDYVSFILERPPISGSEYLDNVVTMFMAGHVCFISTASFPMLTELSYRIRPQVLCPPSSTISRSIPSFKGVLERRSWPSWVQTTIHP